MNKQIGLNEITDLLYQKGSQELTKRYNVHAETPNSPTDAAILYNSVA